MKIDAIPDGETQPSRYNSENYADTIRLLRENGTALLLTTSALYKINSFFFPICRYWMCSSSGTAVCKMSRFTILVIKTSAQHDQVSLHAGCRGSKRLRDSFGRLLGKE